MQNYSQVFADTLAEFESPYVPGDQGDAGKGQVTVRAGYKIYSEMNPHVGYIHKNPGQTQFHGVSVDALQDKSDGTGADYLTDELQPDGRRLIKLAYTAYPGAAVPPTANWVQPTVAYLDYPGPLVLKGSTPMPEPTPPDSNADVLAKLDDLAATLAMMQAQADLNTETILLRDDANTEKIQQQIHQVVEDAEETLKEVLVVLLANRDPEEDVDVDDLATTLIVRARDRRRSRQ